MGFSWLDGVASVLPAHSGEGWKADGSGSIPSTATPRHGHRVERWKAADGSPSLTVPSWPWRAFRHRRGMVARQWRRMLPGASCGLPWLDGVASVLPAHSGEGWKADGSGSIPSTATTRHGHRVERWKAADGLPSLTAVPWPW